GCWSKPRIQRTGAAEVLAEHVMLGRFKLMAMPGPDGPMPELLFTENETNLKTLFQVEPLSPFVKDAFHAYVVQGRKQAVNPKEIGTKVAIHYRLEIAAGHQAVIHLCLADVEEVPEQPFGPTRQQLFDDRIREAEEFYQGLIPKSVTAEERHVARQ